MSPERDRVIILGAGIAGLTAASTLRQHGVPFLLFEASERIAGMGRSFRDEEGFSYDFGAHFITNRLAAALGIGGVCRVVRRYGETVLLRGKTYGYPFGLLSEPRFVLGGVRARLGRRSPPASAAEFFEAAYGEALAREVAIPLVERWAGAPAHELSPAVGEKIPPSTLRTLLLKLAARLTRRAVAIGYCHVLPESPNVWHVYPEGGVEILCRKLAEGMDRYIRLGSPVDKVLVEEERVRGVVSGGRTYEARHVVSTAPVHVLSAIVKGTARLAPFARFRYRPMVFVNLRLSGRGLLPDVVLWTPWEEFSFFRLTETPLSMPWLAPAGRTIITCDIGCQVGDRIWTLPDAALGELCLGDLARIVPDARSRYLGCRVLRTPLSYPVFLSSYEAERQQLARTTGISGLHSIGRNGEFAHLLMEDVYWSTKERMRALARGSAAMD